MKNNYKKTICLLILISMLVSVFTVNGFALADGTETSVNKESMVSRINTWLDYYMSFDSQGKGRGIYANSDFIPLYSMEDEIIAYIVPLFDNTDKETGYLITSANIDGPVMCEMSLDSVVASDYRKSLTDCEKLVYLDLMKFGIRISNSSYYEINDSTLESFQEARYINNSIASTDKSLENFKIEIDEKTANSFASFAECVKANSLKPKSNVCRLSTVVNYDTVDLNFPNLVSYNYGGNQMWWTDYRANYGCGTVAVANSMAYLAMYHNAPSLYQPSNHSITLFTQHMNNVEQYVPASAPLGNFDPDTLINQTVAYANVYLPSNQWIYYQQFNGLFNLTNISNFIIDGLSNNNPVLFLQYSGYYTEYNYHWMTITKYFSNPDGTWVAISTWGERRSLNLGLVVSGATTNHSFLYFGIS